MAGSTQKLADLVRSVGTISAVLQTNYGEPLQDAKPKFEALNAAIEELTPNLVPHGSSKGDLAKTPKAKQSFEEFQTALGELVKELKQAKYNDADISPHRLMLDMCEKNLLGFQVQIDSRARGRY